VTGGRAPVALGVFARAPVPGRTKTRLIPALGADPEEAAARAAALHEAFLEDTLRTATSVAPVTLFVAGSADHPAIERVRSAFDLTLVPQVEGDLGARMVAALESLLERHERAFLIGSDAPTLPARLMRAAARAPVEIVLSPSSDGGYVLVGGACVPRFDGVRWSHPRTLADTLTRNPGAWLTEPWYDVDDPDDLALLRTHLTLDPHAAPTTAAKLRGRSSSISSSPFVD
jgi:rSAM/selenodomain-associated transferase 1